MGLLDGVLPAIYSAGNTAKRRLSGLLADPAGALELGLNRFKEDNNSTLNLMANAYPMAGDKTVLNSQKQKSHMQGLLADKGAEMAMQAATVWHGSPHKFDKFDSSKIGTGEGAQAYGHGLYLAESPDVAEYYQQLALRELGADPYDASVINRFMGKSINPSGNATESLAAHAIADANKSPFLYDPLLAMKNLRDKARTNRAPDPIMELFGIDKPFKKADFDEARKYIRDFSERTNGTGAVSNLYKVDLPDDQIAKMLDWDAPLNRQSDSVKEALNPLIPKIRAAAKDDDGLGGYLGKGIYELLGDGKASPQTAQMLRDAGIPGIRYLDGGSRGAGAGSSNYVVFPGNEGLLSILERNGQPMSGLLK